MKKAIGTGLLTACLFLCFQSVSMAQVKGQTKVGVGLLYGDAPQAVGLQITGTYGLTQKVVLAPDINIYFPGDHEGYWAIDLNGHYIFVNDAEYNVYGLAGLNIATQKVFNEHDTHLGINLGIGGEYQLQNLAVYGELKYVIGNLNQVVIGAGVRFPIPMGN